MKRPLRWPASRVLIFPRTFPLTNDPLLSFSFSGPATITACRVLLPFPGRIQSLSYVAAPGQHACLHVPSSALFMRHPSPGLFDSLSSVVSPWIRFHRNTHSRNWPGLLRTWLLTFSRRRRAATATSPSPAALKVWRFGVDRTSTRSLPFRVNMN